MKLTFLKHWFLAVATLVAMVSFAQTGKISGRILDDDAKPLAGVSVTIKGKATGTQSNTAGDFSIEAAQGDVAVS